MRSRTGGCGRGWRRRARSPAIPCCFHRRVQASINSRTMRNVGEYFRSWFGRFEQSPIRRRPDPWLCLPAAALLALGLLMVLNTTYFLGQRARRRCVPFFQTATGAYWAGLVICVIISQFSLAGSAAPGDAAGCDRGRAADPGLDSGTWRCNAARAPVGPARPGAGRAIGIGEVRDGVFPRGLSRASGRTCSRNFHAGRCRRLS